MRVEDVDGITSSLVTRTGSLDASPFLEEGREGGGYLLPGHLWNYCFTENDSTPVCPLITEGSPYCHYSSCCIQGLSNGPSISPKVKIQVCVLLRVHKYTLRDSFSNFFSWSSGT